MVARQLLGGEPITYGPPATGEIFYVMVSRMDPRLNSYHPAQAPCTRSAAREDGRPVRRWLVTLGVLLVLLWWGRDYTMRRPDCLTAPASGSRVDWLLACGDLWTLH